MRWSCSSICPADSGGYWISPLLGVPLYALLIVNIGLGGLVVGAWWRARFWGHREPQQGIHVRDLAAALWWCVPVAAVDVAAIVVVVLALP